MAKMGRNPISILCWFNSTATLQTAGSKRGYWWPSSKQSLHQRMVQRGGSTSEPVPNERVLFIPCRWLACQVLQVLPHPRGEAVVRCIQEQQWEPDGIVGDAGECTADKRRLAEEEISQDSLADGCFDAQCWFSTTHPGPNGGEAKLIGPKIYPPKLTQNPFWAPLRKFVTIEFRGKALEWKVWPWGGSGQIGKTPTTAFSLTLGNGDVGRRKSMDIFFEKWTQNGWFFLWKTTFLQSQNVRVKNWKF